MFKEGDEGDKFYIILHGEVAINKVNPKWRARQREIHALNLEITKHQDKLLHM